jgi:DNA-binding PadR family transcriptional regulator
MFGRGWGRRPPGRVFEKGDLKYVILELVQEKPRHGYEIIRALEERFAGFYAPSPGAVYPTLQLLEDLGYVAAAQQDGKKIYTLTDAGREFLGGREEVLREIRDRVRGRWGGGGADTAGAWASIKQEMGEIGRLFGVYGPSAFADPEKLRRLTAVLRQARFEIETILKDEGPVTN